ncbi:MAG: site-2 protease family protein [Actinomycetota bacterium]
MESTFTLFKVRGIAIGLNWSWLLIFALVVWSLAQALFPATYPGLGGTTYLFMALVAAAAFFGSVLLHELGHALRAQREGMPIKGITLWLFGGVAHLAGSPPNPGAEFRVAIFGPVISAVLAVGFIGAAFVGDQLGWPGPVQGVVDYLGRINVLVLAFNLIPALPLDGGRVLRSWLWRRQDSFTAATRSASRAGQAFGWMLVAIGVAGLFGGGTAFGGLWLAFIGWFLIQAARAEREQALVRRALAGLRVGDVMRPLGDQATIGPERPAGNGDRGGPWSWPAPAREAASRSATVEADRPVVDAMSVLGETGGRVAVMDGGRHVGTLDVADVGQALERGLARPPEQRPARSAGIAVWVVVGLIIAVAGLALYRPPHVVIAPGEAIEVGDDIVIDGVPVDDLNGRYLIATVSLSRRSALTTLWSALREDRDVVPVQHVFPPGVRPEEFSRVQRQVFDESRRVAAAAAARAVGLPVRVSGSGARILEVVEGSPADDVLRVGDVIVEVDGQPIRTAADVVDAVRSRPAGTDVPVGVERDDGRRTVVVTTEELPDVAGRVGIGVLLETRGLDVNLPFEIRFEDRDIGGPSAGLAYGMAIADLLDEADFARGRTLAATGTISIDGDVGPVGGIEQKAIAVDDAGADLFVVPQTEVDHASGEGVRVRGVKTIEEALAAVSG